ncbi:hypothetical protein ACLB2K_034799 [Fragaria x ananassa]
MSRVQEFRSVTLINSSRSVLAIQKWKPPPAGTFKINVDGSFINHNSYGSTGFVVRDFLGGFIAGGGMSFAGILSAEHMELMACKQGVLFAVTNHFVPAMIETDAQVVAQQLLQQSAFNLTALGRIYDEVRILLHNHPTIKIQYVRRSANNVAHVMASNSKQFSLETFYFSVPSFLQTAVAAEIILV